ncbi:MAG: porin [Acidithiobacillus caldus]|uniref:porin n=1 Tax=Acidithiobacillus caldus TaxID=33059 RepID=UPI002815183D|nr:porin [Acidithiobacillus caldus]WMT46914.1 MAG: porin [Acidithiobacillus caldus]
MNVSVVAKRRVAAALAVSLIAMNAGTVSAANWFKIQDTNAKKVPLISGFIEPDVFAMAGTPVAIYNPVLKKYVEAVPHVNLVGPNFTQSTTGIIQRARLMIRGWIDPHISYFFAGEFGNNAATDVRGHYQPQLQDGRFTFSGYIPGIRVEAGIIRAPSAEDAMNGYMSYNYVVFPTVINQLMLQPFYAARPSSPYAAGPSGSVLVPSSESLGVNAFRYPGIQLFDWKTWGHWQIAYAAMVGMYGSVAAGNLSNSPLYAARLQGSYIFGGHGPSRSDVTAWIWYQNAQPDYLGHAYTMQREGAGFQYLDGYMHRWGRRLKFEYMRGNGWISAPSAFSQAIGLQPALYNNQLYTDISNSAYGYYVEGGLFLTKRIEADVRYDYYNRLPNLEAAGQERVFKTWALALQYHFTPITKLMAGYYFRTVDAPGVAPNTPGAAVSAATDNEFAMQAMISF